MKNDTDLLNWLAKNPTRVQWATGRLGKPGAWYYVKGSDVLPARGLRDAIRKAIGRRREISLTYLGPR